MAIWSCGKSPLLSSRALFLSEALLRGPDDWDQSEDGTPFLTQYGIFGAGLASFFGGFQGAFGICILMDEARVGGPLVADVFEQGYEDVAVLSTVRAVPLIEVADAVELMRALFGDVTSSSELEWINSVAVLPVPVPTPNVGPGDRINASLSGLAGVPVSWNREMRRVFLSAWHVFRVGMQG